MLKAVQHVIGEIPTEGIVSLYGDSQTGKTTLACQIAADICRKKKKKALIFDTEGGVTATVKSLGLQDVIDVHTEYDIRSILYDHGYNMELVVGGKLDLKLKEKFKISDIIKMAKKKEYCCVIYDSYTLPFKLFGYDMENLSSRNATHWKLYLGIIDLQKSVGCAIIQIHHISYPPKKNKNDPNEVVEPVMIGGSAIEYASKYIARLEKIEGTNQRILIGIRHPEYAPKARQYAMKLEKGFKDV